MKKIDAKSIISRIKDKPVKSKVCFSLDPELLENFQIQCKKEGVAMSPVLEELMRSFLENLKK